MLPWATPQSVVFMDVASTSQKKCRFLSQLYRWRAVGNRREQVEGVKIANKLVIACGGLLRLAAACCAILTPAHAMPQIQQFADLLGDDHPAQAQPQPQPQPRLHEEASSTACDDGVGGTACDEGDGSTASDEDVGRTACDEEASSTVCGEEFGGTACDEEAGSTVCDEEVGGTVCDKEAGSTVCGEEVGGTACDDAAGSTACDKDASGAGSVQSSHQIGNGAQHEADSQAHEDHWQVPPRSPATTSDLSRPPATLGTPSRFPTSRERKRQSSTVPQHGAGPVGRLLKRRRPLAVAVHPHVPEQASMEGSV